MEGCCGKFHFKRFAVGEVTKRGTQGYWKGHYLIGIGPVTSLLTSFNSCVSDLHCLQYILTLVNHTWLVPYSVDCLTGWLVLTQYRHSHLTTNVILVVYSWSLLQVCLTMSLESTSQFSPSTSFQSLCLWLAFSCCYDIFSLCQLTTLTIHNSLSVSLPVQNLPLLQIFPTIDSLPASGLTPQCLWLDRFFWTSWLCGRLS